MEKPESPDPARILTRAAGGDEAARQQITSMTYHRLRELASGFLRRERPDHTLQPTALVHEAYIRLVDQSRVDWKDRGFFVGIAAREMRRILIDHARHHKRLKRGGGWGKVLLDQVAIPVGERDIGILDVDEALRKLSSIHERQGRIVELRFFGGFSIEEVAQVLEISPKTVEKDWRIARAWLHRYLAEGEKQ
jgi:RNA polymerase sigma factor (TIGR02999 family)